VLRMSGLLQLVQTFAVEAPARRNAWRSSRSLIGSDSEDVSCFKLGRPPMACWLRFALGDFGTSGSQLPSEVTPVVETRGEG
jgi:hypothetical protein